MSTWGSIIPKDRVEALLVDILLELRVANGMVPPSAREGRVRVVREIDSWVARGRTNV